MAQFGFIVSAAGLGSWIEGGTLNALGLQATDGGMFWGRLTLELIARPQPGWGLSLPMRCLLPLGGLSFLGPPLKYFLGERTGGLTVLRGFGVGWLAIGALLLFETKRVRAG